MNLSGVLLLSFCNAGMMVMFGCLIEKNGLSSISNNVIVCMFAM